MAERTNPDVKISRLASYCVTQYFDHEINHEQPEGTTVSASLMPTIGSEHLCKIGKSTKNRQVMDPEVIQCHKLGSKTTKLPYKISDNTISLSVVMGSQYNQGPLKSISW